MNISGAFKGYFSSSVTEPHNTGSSVSRLRHSQFASCFAWMRGMYLFIVFVDPETSRWCSAHFIGVHVHSIFVALNLRIRAHVSRTRDVTQCIILPDTLLRDILLCFVEDMYAYYHAHAQSNEMQLFAGKARKRQYRQYLWDVCPEMQVIWSRKMQVFATPRDSLGEPLQAHTYPDIQSRKDYQANSASVTSYQDKGWGLRNLCLESRPTVNDRMETRTELGIKGRRSFLSVTACLLSVPITSPAIPLTPSLQEGRISESRYVR